MKKSSQKGFIGIDMAVSLIAIMVFTTLILSLLTYNFIGNAKISREILALVYLTETMENIGIADYNEVIQENATIFVPEELIEKNYNMDIVITNELDLTENENNELIKKVIATISYDLGNKEYQYSMERIKIKE